jgi:DivIVA domain-containing protein
MTITPEQITSKKFSLTRSRGYDREEVDSFLSDMAAAYNAAMDNEPEAPSRMLDRLGEEVSAILRATKESAATLLREAEDEAAGLRRNAAQEAKSIRRQAREDAVAEKARTEKEVRSLIEDAHRKAHEIRDAADRESKELLEEAIRRFDRLQAHERELRERVDSMERLLVMLRKEMGVGSAEDSAERGEPSVTSASPQVVDLRSDGDSLLRDNTSDPKTHSDEAPAT